MKQENRGPKPDPFENPSRDLLVAEIPGGNGGGHVIVLNKFPVIPRHFILATKEFRNQTDLLEKEDLEVAFQCIQAWKSQDGMEEGEERERRLFAFFNSGDESGASQPHRHLQLLPVEDMRDQQEEQEGGGSKWTPLIDRVATADEESGFRHLQSLPFKHFALSLPVSPSPETLYQSYLSLYRAAVEASAAVVGGWTSEETAAKLAQTSGPAAIDYNLAMTESAMMICPRRSETALLQEPAEEGAGKVSLNGTILAGTLMVKQETEWDDLRNKPDKINSLLAAVGIPKDC